MKGKVLIYGGSGGMGSAIGRRLHAAGSALHLAGRNAPALERVASELGAGFTVGDVADDTFFARATADAGEPLSGLVYAVGTINLKPLGRLEVSDFEADFRANALGAALAIKSALGALKKSPGGGAIVLFSSVAASQGFAFHASVAMAKSAVSGLTLSLAAELAPAVRVNAIAPSLTMTPLAAKIVTSEKSAEPIAALHALKRLGTPEDIAGLAAFLLSEDASWVTGQIIGVDGGRSALRTP